MEEGKEDRKEFWTCEVCGVDEGICGLEDYPLVQFQHNICHKCYLDYAVCDDCGHIFSRKYLELRLLGGNGQEKKPYLFCQRSLETGKKVGWLKRMQRASLSKSEQATFSKGD